MLSCQKTIKLSEKEWSRYTESSGKIYFNFFFFNNINLLVLLRKKLKGACVDIVFVPLKLLHCIMM